MRGYDHKEIEKKTQEKWSELELYKTDLADTSKEPYYLLFEFPFPSGDLHIGHWYAYALTDIYARYLRMLNKQVLFPIGFDSFGLPAENAAIKNNASPKEWIYDNIEKMRGQIRTIGTSVDWSREVVTSDPEYYKWTQWLFTKLFEQNLAEHRSAKVKWCPKDKTVLANEQVLDGHCERCDTLVEEKNLTQWFLKITDYAERLINDLDPLPWREEIKEAQRAWIGKSEGARINFQLKASSSGLSTVHDLLPTVSVFTTRPDTLYGVTYVVLAPEHPLVGTLLPLIENQDEVKAYVQATASKTERERSENKEKTGVLLQGVHAINPAGEHQIPVYVADYVLASYGTGAVMAVPAHDERDFAFATKYKLPIVQVIAPRMIDAENPHQEGKETVERIGILAVIFDPATKKYLTLNWKEQPWTTFVCGGSEEGEDPVTAALREIKEETGYTNLQFVESFGQTQSEFFAAHKDLNRVGHSHLLYFELNDDAREDVSDEEVAKHTVEWLDFEELEARGLRHAETSMILHRLKNGAEAYTGDGVLVNSGEFNGRENTEVMKEIVDSISGEMTTQFKIRDWLVSRQRYWGCPIPVVYDPEGNPHAVPLEHLPWTLPTDVSSTTVSDSGKGPLSASEELRERTERLFGAGWTPECDTFDVFMDSAWYFTRYLAPNNDASFSDMTLMKRFLPVNRYSGGNEHTTVHLLYARFFYKALYDLALVPTSEPFLERINRGLILGPDGQKMSKRWGNVVNPDDMVRDYGADAVRTYLSFIGPYNEPGNYPWKPEGIASTRRFLDRVCSLSEKISDIEVSPEIARAVAKATQKAGEDIERFKLNTALSALMILLNVFEKQSTIPKVAYVDFLKLLAPYAPHLTDHLFQMITGSEQSIHQESWPILDESLLVSETVVVPVQIGGKRRAELRISPDAEEAEVLELALSLPEVQKVLGGAPPSRVVYVPGKILNLVA